jgi:hypothetical protein
MTDSSNPSSGCPFFRPSAAQLNAIADDVAEIPVLQRTLVDKHSDLRVPDRIAHQYQIAGSKVELKVAARLPAALEGVGLFQPGATWIGVGRISTGLGMPHIETNPDFLGFMAAFQTRQGQRVDFLAINDPTSPADNHRDFVDVLFATAQSAGARLPFLGDWGERNLGDLAAEQTEFASALRKRMGTIRAGKALAHIVKQTSRTLHSGSAYQSYWGGIVEVGGTLGKFTFVPTRRDEKNERPGLRPGERYLSQEWKQRQRSGDIVFSLLWIPYQDETRTCTTQLTTPWEEKSNQLLGQITFPRTGTDAELWAILASEMGANSGNWVCDRENSIPEPDTEFGNARTIAYRLSQQGRGALDPGQYRSVFETGTIAPDLVQDLIRRRDKKRQAGHVSSAP